MRKTWKERRAEARAAREAKKRAAAEAKAAAAAAAAGADASLTAGAEAATPAAPTATSGAVAPIASAPLDARDPNAVAAKPSPASKRNTVGDAAASAPAPAPAKDAPVVAAGPVRPIQVASFSKEDNARRATEALAKIGITATAQKSEKDGKAVWGVVVQGDEAMLKKIKDAGFADAYFLK
nr:SPOR domain-containing protein [Tabrizicola thermarum]